MIKLYSILSLSRKSSCNTIIHMHIRAWFNEYANSFMMSSGDSWKQIARLQTATNHTHISCTLTNFWWQIVNSEGTHSSYTYLHLLIPTLDDPANQGSRMYTQRTVSAPRIDSLREGLSWSRKPFLNQWIVFTTITSPDNPFKIHCFRCQTSHKSLCSSLCSPKKVWRGKSYE